MRKNLLQIFCLTVFLVASVTCSTSSAPAEAKVLFRRKRGWNPFWKTTTLAPTPTPPPPKLPHNLDIGQCEPDDKLIYIDETSIEANNSTLSGVLEIHIDSTHYITCVQVLDQIPEGNGATPTYNSGGYGQKFVFINVQGQYNHGIHFRIFVRGSDERKNNKSIDV